MVQVTLSPLPCPPPSYHHPMVEMVPTVCGPVLYQGYLQSCQQHQQSEHTCSVPSPAPPPTQTILSSQSSPWHHNKPDRIAACWNITPSSSPVHCQSPTPPPSLHHQNHYSGHLARILTVPHTENTGVNLTVDSDMEPQTRGGRVWCWCGYRAASAGLGYSGVSWCQGLSGLLSPVSSSSASGEEIPPRLS